jgi:aminoglycoside phosphotransferase (APT) family kinase protein
MADAADGSAPDAILHALGLPAATKATLQSGFDAAVWRAELTDGRTVAIRLLRRHVHPDRELAALHLAAEYGHPAPRVLACDGVDGRAALVTTWCDGRPIGDLLPDGGDPAELGRQFGRAQARLHRRMDDGTVLCHLDYQPFNVLVGDGAVTGIVDWSNARAGRPAEDLATTSVILAIAPAIAPELAGTLEEFTTAWTAGYAELHPLPDDDELAVARCRAAQVQLDTWRARAEAGDCAPHVLALAESIAERWQA